MIAIGCDHGGFELKEHILRWLESHSIEYKDFGTYSDASVDYPVFAEKTARAVASGECELGLLFCGTGLGMSYAANKVRGVRAACCSEAFSAEMARVHNNANILCLGGRVVSFDTAEKLVDVFVNTPFSNDERHQRRIDMISDIENRF